MKTKFEEKDQNNPDKKKEAVTGRRRSRASTLYSEVISEEETYLQGWWPETRRGTSPTSSCLASASLTGSTPSSAGSSSRKVGISRSIRCRGSPSLWPSFLLSS